MKLRVTSSCVRCQGIAFVSHQGGYYPRRSPQGLQVPLICACVLSALSQQFINLCIHQWYLKPSITNMAYTVVRLILL
jgi:hypothetical protein